MFRNKTHSTDKVDSCSPDKVFYGIFSGFRDELIKEERRGLELFTPDGLLNSAELLIVAAGIKRIFMVTYLNVRQAFT
jgi:hypothetical protein